MPICVIICALKIRQRGTIHENASDGSYEITYVPEEAGPNKLLLRFNGSVVRDFPATVAVVAGAADANHCTAAGPGLVDGIEQVPLPPVRLRAWVPCIHGCLFRRIPARYS